MINEAQRKELETAILEQYNQKVATFEEAAQQIQELYSAVKRLQSETILNYNTPLEDVDFTVRAFNVIKCLSRDTPRINVTTLGQLTEVSASRLRKIAGAGPKVMEEIEAVLKKAGLNFLPEYEVL